MYKYIAIFTIWQFFLWIASPVLAGSPLPLTEAEQAYLRTKDRITIVYDPDWPPFEYRLKGNRYEGMSIDYHALLAKRIGIPIEPIPTSSWSESLQLAKEGKCDLVSTLNKTPLRSRYLDFTAPFIDTKVVIIGKNDSHAKSLRDFSGKTLAIVKGYKMEEDLARDHPTIRHHMVNSTAESLLAVARGETDATIATDIEALHLIRINKLDTLKTLGTTRYDNHQGLGVRKGDSLLLSIMQKAVHSLSPKDKQLIENKWISEHKTQQPIFSTFSIPLVIAVFFLLAVLTWTMNNQKKRSKNK